MDIDTLLDFTVTSKASDLHLSAGLAPLFRIDGELCSFNYPVLAHQDVAEMIDSIMNDRQRTHYKEQLETDFSFERKQLARFRVNVL